MRSAATTSSPPRSSMHSSRPTPMGRGVSASGPLSTSIERAYVVMCERVSGRQRHQVRSRRPSSARSSRGRPCRHMHGLCGGETCAGCSLDVCPDLPAPGAFWTSPLTFLCRVHSGRLPRPPCAGCILDVSPDLPVPGAFWTPPPTSLRRVHSGRLPRPPLAKGGVGS
eukprot:360163-Chlamydomonas_euryale.AAC.1